MNGDPAELRVVHIGTSVGGGAGIAMSRQHAALLAGGVDSRMLLGHPCSTDDSRVSSAPNRHVPMWRRIARRARLADSLLAQVNRAITIASAKAGQPALNDDIFSAPCSGLEPETHPWVRDASVINLHLTVRTLDWPTFFRTVRVPVVFTLHDQYPYLGGFHYEHDARKHQSLATIESDCRRVKQRALLGRRIAVIGNSEWNTRRATQSGFFEPTTRFETIYYPLDTEAFQPRPKPACRTALGLQLDHTVIGFACDDLGDPRKGFDTLVGALKSLPAELATRISLLSFGRDPSAALKSSIAVPWTHLGYINSNAAKIAAYSAMDLFVVPSHAEAFGQTAIEALACGTAVIASNVGGLREAVDQGRCGHLVEPGDSPALTQAIVDLAQRPDARAALADAGRALVVSRHAPSACARAYETVYSELLRESFVTS